VDNIADLQLFSLSAHEDMRGTFSRLLSVDQHGPESSIIEQISFSENYSRDTFRGMHGMKLAANETKFVSCMRGNVLDFIFDLRPESPSYLGLCEINLSSRDPKLLVIPPGCLHGYLTLSSESQIFYATTSKYDPKLEIGCRWNDPILGLSISPDLVSMKDNSWKDFNHNLNPLF
jgi:dTDP-4-dehydrorhamnose 3,5-epimerase